MWPRLDPSSSVHNRSEPVVSPVEILDPDRAVELSPDLAPLRDLCAAGG